MEVLLISVESVHKASGLAGFVTAFIVVQSCLDGRQKDDAVAL